MATVPVLTLPWPPSVNHIYGRGRNGQLYLLRDGKEYRKTVWILIRAARLTKRLGPVALTIDAYPPDKRLRDVDNLLKAVLDALQEGGAFENDSQVKELHVFMRAPRAAACIDVQIADI